VKRIERKKIGINIKVLAVRFTVVIVICFCSFHAAGQEPDSTFVSNQLFTIPVDSSEVISPDTIIFKSDLPDIADYDIILISDTVALADIFPLAGMDLDAYSKHSPAKAAIMSAVVPGLGQIYNRQYWKVPVVYVAVGASVGFFLLWENEYSRYRRAYIDLKDNDPYTNFHETIGFPPTWSNTEKEQYITKRKEELRTWRDWTILAMVAAYAMNIIDANVFAHLKDFSLDDNLSLKIQPSFLKNGINSQKFALTLQLTF